MENREQNKGGIIRQVAIMFALGITVIAIVTFFSQLHRSDARVKKDTENFAAEIADEVTMAVKEYPSYEWLLSYWYENWETLDIEYDVAYASGTATEEKCQQLCANYPGLQLKYAETGEIEKMSSADQKLYAEIAYSWLITRVNEIKQAYDIDYLFCVLTDDFCKTQFFLFSGADPDSVRGTNYEEVYPLGTFIEVSESQQKAMANALENSEHLADAGSYVDYYAYFCTVDEHPVLIGMTYNLSDLIADIRTQTWSGTAAAIAYQICLALICMGLISGFVLQPLRKIQHNIRIYKQKKDSSEVEKSLSEIRSGNEIGELSEDIIKLTKEIDEYINRIESITAEKERIGTELKMARQIQKSSLPNIFPPFPQRVEFDIYATMEPAKEVGGDFYDFFLIDEDHLGLVISDVSGKGVPAALFMMISKMILQNCAMLGKSPGEILSMTNELICSNNKEEMFITVWLGILEISTGKVKAANAGHEYPVLMHSGERFEIVKDRHGFVIGGMDGMTYHEYEMQLEPGAKLFVYTDGLPEAMDDEKNMFGTERMLDALNELRDQSAKTVIETVRGRVSEFVKDAQQFDDLTMMCLEYKGKQS